MSDDKSGAEIVLAILASVGLILFRPIVVMELWAWFVVPLGLTALAYWHAAGLSLFVGFLVLQATPDDKSKSAMAKILSGWLTTLFVLALGLLFSFGMPR